MGSGHPNRNLGGSRKVAHSFHARWNILFKCPQLFEKVANSSNRIQTLGNSLGSFWLISDEWPFGGNLYLESKATFSSNCKPPEYKSRSYLATSAKESIIHSAQRSASLSVLSINRAQVGKIFPGWGPPRCQSFYCPFKISSITVSCISKVVFWIRFPWHMHWHSCGRQKSVNTCVAFLSTYQKAMQKGTVKKK